MKRLPYRITADLELLCHVFDDPDRLVGLANLATGLAPAGSFGFTIVFRLLRTGEPLSAL